jgi:hypothetical protein
MTEFIYNINVSMYNNDVYCNFLANLEHGEDYVISSMLKSTGIKYMNYYDTCIHFKNEEDLLTFRLAAGI